MCSTPNPRILTGYNPDDYPSRKVAVAMSGGVDSSLAACLLKKAGFDVIGITMNLFHDKTHGNGFKEGKDEVSSHVHDARCVAEHIGIPHYTIDLHEEFERIIISNFIASYISGYTPNPCVLCNKHIKWNYIRKKAHSLGYDLFATGHYARVACHDDRTYSVLEGMDKRKDQSYFLWALDAETLSTTLFPLGAMTKEETCARAREFNLKTAHRAESQEICFIPDNDYRAFLQTRLKHAIPSSMTEGAIRGKTGKILGKHSGTAYYTIGQRKGLGLVNSYPLYVTAIDADTNTLYVGNKDDLYAKSMVVGHTNWIRGFPPGNDFTCTTRIRYRHPGTFSNVVINSDSITVFFDTPQHAVTPGQSAVFYDGDIIMGGGIIKKQLGFLR